MDGGRPRRAMTTRPTFLETCQNYNMWAERMVDHLCDQSGMAIQLERSGGILWAHKQIHDGDLELQRDECLGDLTGT